METISYRKRCVAVAIWFKRCKQDTQKFVGAGAAIALPVPLKIITDAEYRNSSTIHGDRYLHDSVGPGIGFMRFLQTGQRMIGGMNPVSFGSWEKLEISSGAALPLVD